MVQLVSLLAIAGLTNAHFLLNYPTTAGFNDDNEGIAPCGGFSVSYANATNWYVGGDVISLTSTHPAAVWGIRATQDQSVSGNLTNITPNIAQSALGAFCPTGLTLPSSWVGKQGVIQVVQDATDGLLYQCAPVNFVSGTNPSVPSSCKNATGVTASYTAVAALAIGSATGTASVASSTASAASSTASAASSTAASTATSSGTATSTGTAATASSTVKSEAVGHYVLGSVVLAAAGVVGAFIGL